MDNASELENSEVVSHFANRRIIYRRHSKNLGGIENGLIALREYTDTKYLMIFHDDDLMHPRLLESEIAILEQTQDVAFVSTTFQGFEGEPPEFPSISHDPDIRYCSKVGLVELLLAGLPLHFGSTIYRSDTLHGHSINYERYAKISDRPFLLAILGENRRCAVIPEPFVQYRIHPNQDSQIGDLESKHIIEIYKTYHQVLKDGWSMRAAWSFYKTTGYELIDSYWRLPSVGRESLMVFLRRGYRARIFLYPFALVYFIRRLNRFSSIKAGELKKSIRNIISIVLTKIRFLLIRNRL